MRATNWALQLSEGQGSSDGSRGEHLCKIVFKGSGRKKKI